jgi:hypothetical protein
VCCVVCVLCVCVRAFELCYVCVVLLCLLFLHSLKRIVDFYPETFFTLPGVLAATVMACSSLKNRHTDANRSVQVRVACGVRRVGVCASVSPSVCASVSGVCVWACVRVSACVCVWRCVARVWRLLSETGTQAGKHHALAQSSASPVDCISPLYLQLTQLPSKCVRARWQTLLVTLVSRPMSLRQSVSPN